MKQTLNFLDNYNVPLFEKDKVRQLLDHINCPNKDLKTEVYIYRSIHSDSFNTYYTYLSTFISRLLTATQPSSGRNGQILQVNTAGREVRGGRAGRFRGKWGHGRGVLGVHGVRGKLDINQSENGVGISDPTRWYGKEELSRLIWNTQQRILNIHLENRR